jgi:hypothetical protein
MEEQEQASTVFEYNPLPGPDYIRLLRLDHGKTALEDGTTASLEVHQLSRSPSYSTLSYSWGRNKDGDASPSRHIHINGSRVPVTENLFAGLIQLRRLAGVREGLKIEPLLWIWSFGLVKIGTRMRISWPSRRWIYSRTALRRMQTYPNGR